MADPKLVKGPLKTFLTRSGFYVQGQAKERAPVDTGRLRNSIATKVEETRALIGTNLSYAPHVEFGSRPHWPPLSAMQPWARRHGFPAGRRGAFLVARRIAQRGTKARLFLTKGLAASTNQIARYLEMMAREMEGRWGR
jgi:phage gpG-like protein